MLVALQMRYQVLASLSVIRLLTVQFPGNQVNSHSFRLSNTTQPLGGADRDAMQAGLLTCGSYNENELIEKAAEVFAAEFIYPEDEFEQDISAFKGAFNVAQLKADDLIHFKRNGCKAKVSYTFLRKRLEWLGLAVSGQFAGVKFQKREEELYGTPLYKQNWVCYETKNQARVAQLSRSDKLPVRVREPVLKDLLHSLTDGSSGQARG